MISNKFKRYATSTGQQTNSPSHPTESITRRYDLIADQWEPIIYCVKNVNKCDHLKHEAFFSIFFLPKRNEEGNNND